uniref:Uncharacterized protein n=2 Tax=Oryza rufipogon TaxID=4529 RepID=A0A0E0P9C9_ORYRU
MKAFLLLPPPMESLASQARPAAVVWLAGFLQAARLHRVVSFCASSRPLSARIAQCFLLNGFIFLGSQLQGQHLCDHTVAVATYSFLRSVLIQIFYLRVEYTLVWTIVLPFSRFPYNDIAKHALDVVKRKSLDATKALDAHTISESTEKPEGVAIGIGEQVYSILLLTIFFIEVSVIGYIPYFGKPMNFLLLSLMYAYYCFEYKWNFFAVSLNERLDFFESNWAFFAGFGTQAEKVIDQLKPSHGGKLQRIPVFFIAKRLTTREYAVYLLDLRLVGAKVTGPVVRQQKLRLLAVPLSPKSKPLATLMTLQVRISINRNYEMYGTEQILILLC